MAGDGVKGPTGELGGAGGVGPSGWGWTSFMNEGEHVPELRWPEDVRWYERMLWGDTQIIALYLGLTLELLGWTYWVNPPADLDPGLAPFAEALAGDLGLPLGEPPADFEPSGLPGLYAFDFVGHASEALLALAYGHYYFEQVGVWADPAEGGDGLWHLEKLAPRAPQTIEEFDVTPRGDLVAIRQSGAVVQVDGGGGFVGMGRVPPIPAERLVWYVWQPDARRRWTGRSWLRSLYRPWLVKDRLIRIDAINHDRAGGIPWVGTDATWKGADLNDLARVAQQARVSSEGAGALPPGAQLNLARVGGTDVVGSMRYHDESMARAWSGMVRQLGATAQGSRALGETQGDLESAARRAVLGWMLSTFAGQAVRAWWSYNVPRQPGQPLPAFPTIGARPPKTGGAPAQQGPAQQPDQPPGGTPPDPQEAPPQPQAASGGAAGRRRTRAASGPSASAGVRLPPRPLRREPSEAEVAAAVDFASIDLAYETASVDAVKLWREKVLPAQIGALADAIVTTKKGEPRKVVTRAAMAALRAPVMGADELAALLLPAARTGAAGAVAEALHQGVGVVTVPSDEALAALVADHAQAVAIQAADGLSLSASRRAVQLVGTGQAPNGVAAQVVNYLQDLKHQWTADQLNGAVQMAVNAGRYAVMDQVAERVDFYEASELLDASTCDPCAANDGKQYASMADVLVDYPSGGFVDCQGGPRCRGTAVAVYGEL